MEPEAQTPAASPLPESQALKQWAIIDAAQQRLCQLPGGLHPRAAWWTDLPFAAVLVAFGALSSVRDPAWAWIAAFVAFALALAGWQLRHDRRQEQRAGLAATRRRITRSGRGGAVPSGFVFMVVIISFQHSGAWWIGIPLAALSVLSARWRIARWHGMLERKPKLRVVDGEASPAAEFGEPAALAIGAVLALVDWANEDLVAEASGVPPDVVDRVVLRLADRGWVRSTQAPAGAVVAATRLALTRAGREAFAHHVDWLETPGGEVDALRTRQLIAPSQPGF